MSTVLSDHSEDTALLLQRVADGQASDGDLERFAALLDQHPELADEVEALQSDSRMVREAFLAAADGVDFRAMQARVFQEIATPASAPVAVGFWARVKQGLSVRMVLAPLGAVAAAAALGVLVPALVDEPQSLPPGLQASRATEIHTLDTDSTTAVVFQTPASGLTVIWLAGMEPEDEDEDAVLQDATEDTSDEDGASEGGG